MVGGTSSLFLLGPTWDESPALVRDVRESGEGKNGTILALDFWAGWKLRKASIAYETPREYLDVRLARDLDATAARLARTWYKPLGNRLDHRGIPLGQMVELDFTYLFIDALRSVEIAQRVLREHDPDRIVLAPSGTACRPPATICHESLPSIVAYLAGRRKVAVTWAGPAVTEGGLAGPRRDAPRRRGGMRRRARSALDLVRRGFEISRALSLSLAGRRRDRVLFTRVSSFPRIAAAMNRSGPRSFSLPATRSGWLNVRLQAGAIRALWDELREEPSFRDALTRGGIPLSEILNRRFEEFFHQTVPELMEYIEGAHWQIRVLKPRMLVVPEDVSPVRRTVSRAFRRQGVPILLILHGAVSVDIGGFFVMPFEADRAAVWGDMVRDWHVKRGKAEDSQVVTGNPGFDPIAGGYTPQEASTRRRLDLRRDAGMILVATEWFTGISVATTVEDEERFIRHTLRALKQFPDYQIVVKLHPNFQAAYQRMVLAVAEEEELRVTIAKDSLWDLLVLSDLAVVSNSTVGIEAMILETPVVVVRTYEGVEMIPYVDEGAALGASGPEEIASSVARALKDDGIREKMEQAREAFVRGYAHTQDGKASERVAALIGSMAESTSHDGSSGRSSQEPQEEDRNRMESAR